MKVVTLPSELSAGQLAIACLVERASLLTVGWQVWLGNGVADPGPLALLTLTLEQSIDDSLVIRLNGAPIRDIAEEPWGGDGVLLEFDLLALAAAVSLTPAFGDTFTLAGRDNFIGYYSTSAWTVVATYESGRTETYTGGTTVTAASTTAPLERDMGGFTLGAGLSVADRYTLLASDDKFALRGILAADYSADSLTIDSELGLQVQLQGVDNTLPEVDLFGALSNELLVFLDDEILSVSSATLVATDTYRLQVVRGRYGTLKADHAAGAEAWIIARNAVRPITHPQIRAGHILALKQLDVSSVPFDLSDIDAVGITVTGETFIPPPRNLRIGTETRNLKYTSGESFRLDWSLPENIDHSGAGAFRFATLVEFLDADEDLLGSLTVRTAFVALSATQMAAILGAETEVLIRLTTIAETEDQTLYSESVTSSLSAL